MEARFAIFEIILIGLNYRVGNFRFLKTNNNLSFLKSFEKITKNVISRKLQGFEQSYLEARYLEQSYWRLCFIQNLIVSVHPGVSNFVSVHPGVSKHECSNLFRFRDKRFF